MRRIRSACCAAEQRDEVAPSFGQRRYAAETFHQIEDLSVDLERIDRGAALLSGAPGLRIYDALVSLAGRLGHVTLLVAGLAGCGRAQSEPPPRPHH